MVPLLPEEQRERCGNGAKILDEAPVVSDKAKEAAQPPCIAGLWLGRHRFHLGAIHGNPCSGDHMAQVLDRGGRERALRPLYVEVVHAQDIEDSMDML